MDLKEMLAKRAKLLADVRAIVEKAKLEKRDLTEVEAKSTDDAVAEAESLQKQIEKRSADDKAKSDRVTRLADAEKWEHKSAGREVEDRTDPQTESEKRSGDVDIRVLSRLPNVKPQFRDAFGGGELAKRNAYEAGQWLLANVWANERAMAWCKDHGVECRALGTNVPASGGYITMPEVLSSAIINLKELRGVFRANAMVVPMPTESLTFPRRTAGMTAYPVAQNNSSAVTQTTPTFDQVQLVAREWGTLSLMSRVMMEDAVIDIGALVADEAAYAFANAEDTYGFTGTGDSTSGGIYGLINKANDGNHAGTLYTAASGHTAFSTLTLADFEGMVGALPQYAAGNAKWYFHRTGFANSAQRLVDAAGGNTNLSLAAGAPQFQFLGYPVVFSQVLNSTTGAQVSTAGLCVFGDLRQTSVVGDRRAFNVQVLRERYAELSQVGIYCTQRFDIVNHELGGASTAGSSIVLKTPAS